MQLLKEGRKKETMLYGNHTQELATTKIPQQTTKAKEKTRARNQSTRNLLS